MSDRVVGWWLAALSGAAAFFLTAFAAFGLGTVKRTDQSILASCAWLFHRPHVYAIANAIARLCDPKLYVALAAVPIAIALVRGRRRPAIASVAILVGASVTTQLVQPLFSSARPSAAHLGISPSPSSWPSGHATAAMALALAALIALPPGWRRWSAAGGAAFAIAVSYSVLVLRWHYASDVVGGLLVAGVWGIAVIGVAFRSAPVRARRAWAEPRRAQLSPSLVVLLGALALVGSVALALPLRAYEYPTWPPAFAVAGATIALLAVVLASGAMLALPIDERSRFLGR